MKGKKILGTHNAPDLDAIAAIWLLQTYGDKKQKEAVVGLFLTEGDAALITPQLMGVTLLDRGRGELDHHGNNENEGETTTSLVAKKLGVAGDKPIQRLLAKVQRSDLQGESLPFDASDIIKCMQRLEIPNEKIIELGIRIVRDGVGFSAKKLTRDNHAVQRIIQQFLADKQDIPPKFQQYLESLNNPRFERPFDLVEIQATEGENINNFILELLDYEFQDSVNYLRAIEEARRAWKTTVRGVNIIADISDNSKFKDAARNNQGALITIQRKTNGQTGLYFDTERIDDSLVEALVSMIRLEECLIQRRQIPKMDLRRPGWVEGIPEWYYYKAPHIPGKNKRPGRFILNGSITAPDVPPSKIPMDVLRYIAEKAVLYQPFNWVRWEAERLAYYINNKKK